MPFSFHPDARSGIFHIRAVGQVDDTEVVDLWDRLSHETAFISGWPILCDCSGVTALLVSSNVIESFAKAARTRHNPVAIIAQQAVAFGLARMYQILNDPDDKRIHIFAKAHEASVWLAAGMKETARHA